MLTIVEEDFFRKDPGFNDRHLEPGDAFLRLAKWLTEIGKGGGSALYNAAKGVYTQTQRSLLLWTSTRDGLLIRTD